MPDYTMLAAPCLNLNGTARSDLIDNHIRTVDGLRDAVRYMNACMPNRQDYPGRPDLYAIAHRQHIDRITVVARALAEMQFIAEKIDGQDRPNTGALGGMATTAYGN